MTPAQITEHLFELETALMQPDVRRAPDRLRAIISEDFLEFGASGRTYDLATLIALLSSEPDGPAATISEFKARLLSSDIVLVTYRTQRGQLARLRSSIWRREGEVWRLHFHQGTPTG